MQEATVGFVDKALSAGHGKGPSFAFEPTCVLLVSLLSATTHLRKLTTEGYRLSFPSESVLCIEMRLAC